MIDLSKLWPHQKEAFEFGKDLPAFFNAGSTGIGKSLANAKIAEHFLESGGSRVLITCPKTLVRSAWLNEFTKHMPGIELALAEAPEDNRKKAFDSNSDVVVMNVDGLKWLASQSKRWLKNRFGKNALLINDESHALKNPNALRTKAALDIAQYFNRRHNMSGTPAPNSVVELWSQVKILDGGKRLGIRYTQFRNIMQVPVQKGPFTQWIDRADAAEITFGLLSDILIRHSFEDVMKHVPDMEHHIVWYDLPKKHRKIYDELEKNEFIEYEGKPISAVNAAALAGKLLQCASGAAYNDPTGKDRTWSILDSGRYELIADLIEARPHTVVFISWEHQRDAIATELKKRQLSYAVIDGSVKSGKVRDESVKDMQAGNLRAIIAHPLSAGHGITLTKSTTVIFASPVYRADLYQQGTARIRRGTQDKATESIVILAKDTRDEAAYEVFVGKKDRMEALHELFEHGF